MDLFKRAVLIKRNSTTKIKYLNRSFTTKDLYLSDVILIDFILGQEIFYFVAKSKTKPELNKVYSSKEINELLDDEKVLAIELKSLKIGQFKSEQKKIDNFIKQVGGQ